MTRQVFSFCRLPESYVCEYCVCVCVCACPCVSVFYAHVVLCWGGYAVASLLAWQDYRVMGEIGCQSVHAVCQEQDTEII